MGGGGHKKLSGAGNWRSVRLFTENRITEHRNIQINTCHKGTTHNRPKKNNLWQVQSFQTRGFGTKPSDPWQLVTLNRPKGGGGSGQEQGGLVSTRAVRVKVEWVVQLA